MSLANDLLDEQMPHSPDAERAVLGAILIRNQCFYRVSELSTDDFFKSAHALIFATMAAMIEDGTEIESLTLKHALQARNELDEAGGQAYISALIDVVPDIANVERYAEILKEFTKRRNCIVTGNRLIVGARDYGTPPEETIATAMSALGDSATPDDQQAKPLVEVLTEAYDYMEGLKARNESVALRTGWMPLDEHKVFSPVFAVFGGDSKAGKTCLMVNLAEALASYDQPCAILSLESSKRALALRYLSMRTQIPHRYMRDWRTFESWNYAKVNEVRKEAARRGIYVGFGPFTAEEILTEIRRLRVVHGIRAAFVDYIQNVDLKKDIPNREERFHKISKMFQIAAPELDVTIVAMSQLREGAGSDGAALTINDIAYAKSIGKSARVGLFFRRDGCKVDFSIAANNEERTNDFCAHFNESTQTFEPGGGNEGRDPWLCENGQHRRPAAIVAPERSLF